MKWTFWTRTQPADLDDCGAIDPLLSLYADGLASAGEAQRVETHLPGCPACREALAWVRATQRALAARPVASPPADLHARIAAAIAASSEAPETASFQTRRGFALRPMFAAAASVAVLGVVSYGLLHTQTPQTARQTVPAPTKVAAAPSVGPSVSLTPTITPHPGVKPRIVRHLAVPPKPARSNPDLMARAQPNESQPEPVAAKASHEVGSAAKPPIQPAPLMASIKLPVPTIKKPSLPKFKPDLMATSKHPVPSSGTRKVPVPQPEAKKPEAIVATTAQPTSPTAVPVNVGAPTIKQDPAPTVVVVSTHESHAQRANLLSLGAYVGQMKSFTHNTVSREAANGATYAVRTLDSNKTPGIDLVHGPLH